ncbi:MAG: RNase adapter RapZ [Thermodesulfobacteriota bacterium]
MPILVVTGLSGSGKTTVIKALEDLGFFCLDNLPIVLLPKFLELRISSSSEISKVAVVIDIRAREFLEEAPRLIGDLRSQGYDIRVLFLECEDSVLIRRFSETRRSHPLARGRPLMEGIQQERELLAELRSLSDLVIDTSSYNVHQLKEAIETHLQSPGSRRLQILVQSFGYRYGVPSNTDMVMDVRFLPNPYFVEGLRERTGQDPAVAAFVLERQEAEEFLQKLQDLVAWLLPMYVKEGKSYLTISVGCTGGRHRSVAIAERMASFFRRFDYLVSVHHRDIHKE